MECEDVQRRIEIGGDVGGPKVVAHLEVCPACAAMVSAASRLPRPDHAGGPAPSWAALATTIEREERTFSRMRSWPTARRRAVGLLLALAVPMLVLVATPRPDLAVYPWARWVIECVGLLAVIVWGAMLTLGRLHRPIHAGVRDGVGLAAVLVVVALAALPAAHGAHPASLVGDGADLLGRAIGCFSFGTLCAVPTWVALRLLARDGDRPGARATTSAAVSATVGVAAVYLHCPIVHSAHLWLGHVPVLLLPFAWAVLAARRAGR